MKFNPTVPIYLQIMDSIKKDIVTGTLAHGERVESVRVLSEKFGVNLNTMQRACSELEREGVIYTQRGVGSFVTEDEKVVHSLKQEMCGGLVDEFINGMRGIGFTNNEILKTVEEALAK
ncbi:GntR family transcriptional regulator [Leptolinea tardivitalis]|uniref:GntR family transcriptional regulator n=2 Tax=Leptolinea tardivitalis TaxID=229920 RepID=A0A0P6WQT8_9CHLR|nr:GntR family transcriptional regulator [Leptolinea tardivitalis]GAP22616.1 predicted transcriptional regulator [Leptolinea tardivitalis]